MNHMVIDYAMCVDEGLIEHSPDSWSAFVDGYRNVYPENRKNLTLLQRSVRFGHAISFD
jgi:hypothetical protein